MRIVLIFICLFTLSQFSAKAINADSILYDQKKQPDSVLIDAFKTLHSHYSRFSTDSAILYASQGLKAATERKNPHFIVDMHIRLGSSYIDIADYTKALDNLTKALQIAEETSYIRAIPIIYNNMGIVHASNKNYNMAKKYYNLALKNDSILEDWVGLAIDLSNLGEILTLNNEHDLAIRYYKIAYNIYDSLQIAVLQPATLNNIGETFYKQQKYDSALFYFQQSVKQKKELGLENKLVPSYINIGQIYLATNENDSAQKYFNESLVLSDKYGLLKEKQTTLKSLSVLDYTLEKYNEAYQNLLEHTQLKDSIFNIEKDRELKELAIRYEVDKKDREINLLNIEVDLQTRLRNLGIITLLLLSAIFILIYKRVRLRSLLLQKQNELEKERSEKLKFELESKNRELTAQSMVAIQKNQVLNDLKNQLVNLKDKNETTQQALSLVDNQYSVEKDWKTLKIHFEEVHPQFFQNLKSDFPKLTSNDLRHCAYIKIHMQTKDVARIMNVEPKSIQMTRYRLKKKLNLTEKENLEDILNTY